MTSRHSLDPSLDRRLIDYASTGWNAHEAVYTLQQMVNLLPVFRFNLEYLYDSNHVIGDVRRAWGVVADLVSAMTGLPATAATLADLGFHEVLAIGGLIDFGGDFALASSPVIRRLEVSRSPVTDVAAMLRRALDHDRVAKPLLLQFQEELRAYDLEALQASEEIAGGPHTFREMVRTMADRPSDFPLWDGRPLFIDEQKALLDYLAKRCGTEIVADSLVDEILGDWVLRAAGIVSDSSLVGEPVLDVNRVPHELLSQPVALISHRAGHVMLEALASFDDGAASLDQLYVAERAMLDELGLDISSALAFTRHLLVDRSIRSLLQDIVDLRGSEQSPVRVAPSTTSFHRYDFPDFS